MTRTQLGFFTRLLDDGGPAERYRLGLEQIRHAEAEGYDVAAVAQHHFNGDEGGLPSPLVFLSHAAALTSRIRLTTGVITLPHENPVRVAEDAAVLDALSGGRVELGFASGGSPSSFSPFGLDVADRREIFATNLDTLERALAGEDLGGGNRIQPEPGALGERVWLATFSEPLAVEAGRRGHGLMLSRTQPRPEDAPDTPLWDVQNRLIDAYLEHLPDGVAPRVSVARTVFVADDRDRALQLADAGLRRSPFVRALVGDGTAAPTLRQLLTASDTHVGTADDVVETLGLDTALARATHLSFQVHSVDPPHPYILRSIELIARDVAPALGWTPSAARGHDHAPAAH